MTATRRKQPTKAEIAAENRRLRKQLEELESKKRSNNPTPDEDELRMDSYIPVISLCPTVLNISTARTGPKKTYRFKEFGSEKRIMYERLADIIEVNQSFAEAGLFYIADDRVVRRHGLSVAYEKILNKAFLEDFFAEEDVDVAFSVFSSTNKKQQEVIAEMLEQKMIDGLDVDMNLIHKISDHLGINISEKVETALSYSEMFESK